MAQQTAEASTTDGSNPGSSSRVAGASDASRWAAIRALVIRFRWPLVDASPERRYAAACAVAALGVLGIRDYAHFYLSAQSDPMIVALCLAAVDCYLCRRLQWSFWLWVLGALGRPEVWPFLGLYTVWLWRRDPAQRRMIIAGLEKANLVHDRPHTRELDRLAAVITRLGGIDRIWACGRPNLPVDYQSGFAWLTDRDIGALHMSTKVVQQAPPIVTFHPLHDGWAIVPSHLTTAAQRAACHGVPMTYRS